MIAMIVLCSLAAVGVVLLIWVAAALMVLPMRGSNLRCELRCGAASDVEQQSRAFLWLTDMGLIRIPLDVVDCGMTPEQRSAAQILAREHPSVRLIPREGENE